MKELTNCISYKLIKTDAFCSSQFVKILCYVMRGVEFIGPGYICSDGYEPPLFSTLLSTDTGATFSINQFW